MKIVCFSVVIFAAVIHDVHSGIFIEKVGDTLERIKCKTQSIGNRLFHRGQTQNLCDERQDARPQGEQNQYGLFGHYNNQGVNGFQIWKPFTNREHGSWGLQNTNHNGGYTDKPNSNNNIYGNVARPISNNQDYGSVYKPSSNNVGYGNIDQSFPGNQNTISTSKPLSNNGYGNIGQSVTVEQGYRSTAKPPSSNVNYGYGHGSLGQPISTNQSSGSIHESSSNIGQPSLNNQNSEGTISVDGKREQSTAANISNQNAGKQSQNCTVIDVRYGNNNKTGVPNNCTQDGRRFLTAIKANCPAGEIADRNGVCREMYRR